MQSKLVAFMINYENANNGHDFAKVKPFIAPDATYWFTDGSYAGIGEIQQAIESTFTHIKNECYSIRDLRFPIVTETIAVCTYIFHWEGIVDCRPKTGNGRGTNVLEKRDNSWKIIHEHLSL